MASGAAVAAIAIVALWFFLPADDRAAVSPQACARHSASSARGARSPDARGVGSDDVDLEFRQVVIRHSHIGKRAVARGDTVHCLSARNEAFESGPRLGQAFAGVLARTHGRAVSGYCGDALNGQGRPVNHNGR